MNRSSDRVTRVCAEVFACLTTGEFRIVVLPGSGWVDGGAPWDVCAELLPFSCRMPNAALWVTIDLDRGEVLEIEPRKSDE